MRDWNAQFQYFDDDELAADWFNRMCSRFNHSLFENQDQLLYRAGELYDGSIPRFKEGAIDEMARIFDDVMGWMKSYLVYEFIKDYRLSNVDLSHEMIEWLIDEMGADAYGDWEIEARNHIVDDYAAVLGRERAEELAVEWWGENNGVR